MLTNNIILLMGIAGTGKMSIGEAIVKQNPHFKLVTPDSAIDPVLKLLGDNEQVWWSLDEKGWTAVNQALDVMLYTIAEVCPKESNFVITSEMLADNPYHQNYFERVQHAATRRAATLTPVRLICELNELLDRVQNTSRLASFKTRDVELIKKRFAEEQVFFSKKPNELTLDVTHLTPDASSAKIMQWVTNHQ
jgi:aminoglycoside 6'-N-acetyltransferase